MWHEHAQSVSASDVTASFIAIQPSPCRHKDTTTRLLDRLPLPIRDSLEPSFLVFVDITP